LCTTKWKRRSPRNETARDNPRKRTLHLKTGRGPSSGYSAVRKGRVKDIPSRLERGHDPLKNHSINGKEGEEGLATKEDTKNWGR